MSSESIAAWIGLVAAPSLFGVIVYFFHDYKTKTDDKFTRMEALIEELSKEYRSSYQQIKHNIDIVINDDSKALMINEFSALKQGIIETEGRLEKKRLDIDNHYRFIQRHEKALAAVYQLIKSHHNRIQDIYKTLRNKGLS